MSIGTEGSANPLAEVDGAGGRARGDAVDEAAAGEGHGGAMRVSSETGDEMLSTYLTRARKAAAMAVVFILKGDWGS
jgi:hypothetical protein